VGQNQRLVAQNTSLLPTDTEDVGFDVAKMRLSGAHQQRSIPVISHITASASILLAAFSTTEDRASRTAWEDTLMMPVASSVTAVEILADRTQHCMTS
jgi:hypothetical protein